MAFAPNGFTSLRNQPNAVHFLIYAALSNSGLVFLVCQVSHLDEVFPSRDEQKKDDFALLPVKFVHTRPTNRISIAHLEGALRGLPAWAGTGCYKPLDGFPSLCYLLRRANTG